MKNTQIFFCGDVHGNFKHVIEAVRKHRPEAVVFLGDLQPSRLLEQDCKIQKNRAPYLSGSAAGIPPFV